jgi:predicted nuclease of predicted toxin-antitoxin system
VRILADENVASEMVEWLRSAGHDVLWAAESLASRSDGDLLDTAVSQQRVVLTRDRDFGELAYLRGARAAPTILMRLHMLHPRNRLRVLQRAWPDIESKIAGHFIVVLPGRLRVRALPTQT